MRHRSTRRLMTVSNRLPIVLRRDPDAPTGWRAGCGDGGLVSALAPVLKAQRGERIGWPGIVEEDATDLGPTLAALTAEVGYTLTPVELSADQRDRFYLGFSNEVIWPLFHDPQTRANFDPGYYAAYEEVNRRFAAVIGRRAGPDDIVWVHGYHLINVAHELRALDVGAGLIFFLHIPFPPPDIFFKLPWRTQILDGMLAYDHVAFRHALQRAPELCRTVTFVQVAVPSRNDIPEYQGLKQRIERLVGEINGELTHLGWAPIHYIHRSLPFVELLAHYRAADVMLVTPLKDGMNLVAKEYCAAHLTHQGALILSEFAGAAAQLAPYALAVNPYDIDGVADAIIRACRMPLIERIRRMEPMRAIVREQDVFWWAEQILRAEASDLEPGTHPVAAPLLSRRQAP